MNTESLQGKEHSAQQLVREVLASADIRLNGTRPWDIQVKDPSGFYGVLKDGISMGAGESYMKGQWECDQLDEMVCHLRRANIPPLIKNNPFLALSTAASLLRRPTKAEAFEVADVHYNLPPELFTAMLDQRMVYTCGYWKDAENLEQAQLAKLGLVCRKMGLEPGMRVLDIGGGWSSLAIHAALYYGVNVVNISVSEEQIALADKRGGNLVRAGVIENRLQDYRDINDGPYDRIVSIGMFEHVGHKNYREYMEVVRRNLKPDGLFLLHTMGSSKKSYKPDPWITKYIFPHSETATLEGIAKASKGLFVPEDIHNIGPDYDKTLMAWFKNFDEHWQELKPLFVQDGQDPEMFYRMWKFYLLASAGTFRARALQVFQIVLSPQGVSGGYQSVR